MLLSLIHTKRMNHHSPSLAVKEDFDVIHPTLRGSEGLAFVGHIKKKEIVNYTKESRVIDVFDN